MMILGDEHHKVVVFREFTPPGYVQANQVLIVDRGEGFLADPGGRVVFNKLVREVSAHVPLPRVKYLFFSHQDPDILGAAAVWYTALINAKILIPEIWQRFLPHSFYESVSLEGRLEAIPDNGMRVRLGESELFIVPAHFLHSPGNFQIYDPRLRLLYSGDLFASLFPPGVDYDAVEDFDAHVKYMEFFHRRYIATRRAIEAWLKAIEGLRIEVIVPQHGAVIKGVNNVEKAIEWIKTVKGYLD